MTIQTRKPKIKQTKVSCLVPDTYFEVNGSDDKYHVAIAKRPLKVEINLTNGRKLTAWQYKPVCKKYHSEKALECCKGNNNGTVCYHSLAAIEMRASVNGKNLVLPKDGELSSAIRLLNFGGQLVKLTNEKGNSKWGVVR